MDERRRSLKEVVQQGWDQVRDQFLEQLRGTMEGLLEAERDRRLAQFRQQRQKVYRSGVDTSPAGQPPGGPASEAREPAGGLPTASASTCGLCNPTFRQPP